MRLFKSSAIISLGGMALLIEAARRGVKVKIIMDTLSSTVPKPVFAALKLKGTGPDGKPNIEFKLYNPTINPFKLTHRDHAKLLIVDGDRLLTVGRNVGDKYFGINSKNYIDLDLLLKGDVAKVARENFFVVWNNGIAVEPNISDYLPRQGAPLCLSVESPELCKARIAKPILQQRKQAERLDAFLAEINRVDDNDIVTGDTGTEWFDYSYEVNNVRFISHEPTELVIKSNAKLSYALLRILLTAKKDVDIVTPYLIPTENVLRAFKKLRERGVRVRILTNSLHSTDNPLAQAGYYYKRRELVKFGVELHEFIGPHTIHAKTAVIDGQHVLIGTFNMDPRSAFLNREVAVSINDREDPILATQLTKIIDGWRSHSKLTAKDGKEYNLYWQFLSDGKILRTYQVSLYRLIMPLIINQL